jgi:hypothetical protein
VATFTAFARRAVAAVALVGAATAAGVIGEPTAINAAAVAAGQVASPAAFQPLICHFDCD